MCDKCLRTPAYSVREREMFGTKTGKTECVSMLTARAGISEFWLVDKPSWSRRRAEQTPTQSKNGKVGISVARLLIYWFNYLLVYLFIDLRIYWFIDLFIDWLIYLFIYSFIHPFIHPFIRSFVHPSIHYALATWQCQWRHYVFRLFHCPTRLFVHLSVHPVAQSDIVITISCEWFVQCW